MASVEGSTPPQSFYDDQVLEPGYGYITTRDGTQLSVFVSLPGPPEDGPYPVLVNYSGYDPSQPVGALAARRHRSLRAPRHAVPGALRRAERARSADRGRARLRDGGRQHARHRLLGRRLRLLRAAPAPRRLRHHRDGRRAAVGRTRSAWSASRSPASASSSSPSTQPPSLAAITPLAVISGVDTTMKPGGILNDGFAIEWGTQVLEPRRSRTATAGSRGRSTTATPSARRTSSSTRRRSTSSRRRYDHPFYEPDDLRPAEPAQLRRPHRGAGLHLAARGRTSRRAATSRICGTASRTRRSSASTATTAPTPTASRRRCSPSGRTSSTSTWSDELRPVSATVRSLAPLLFERDLRRAGRRCPTSASRASRASKRRARPTRRSRPCGSSWRTAARRRSAGLGAPGGRLRAALRLVAAAGDRDAAALLPRRRLAARLRAGGGRVRLVLPARRRQGPGDLRRPRRLREGAAQHPAGSPSCPTARWSSSASR